MGDLALKILICQNSIDKSQKGFFKKQRFFQKIIVTKLIL